MTAPAHLYAGPDAAFVDNDEVQREVAHRLLDAIEAEDFDAVRQVFDPEATLWFNTTRTTIGVDECVAKLEEATTMQRRRTYNDRTIDTVHDGFLARYAINVVRLDGTTGCHAAAVVARTVDGRIVEMYEYLDSGKFGRRS